MQHLKQSSFSNNAPVCSSEHTRPLHDASVGLYVTPRFPIEEYALFASAILDTDKSSGNSVNLEVLSRNGGFVQGSCSAGVQTGALSDYLNCLDFLVVFGERNSDFGKDHRFRTALHHLRRRGCKIAAIGDAAMALSEAHLLESKYCAVHWQNREQFNGLMSTLDLSDKVCLIDDGDWSSCGKTGALDLAIHVLAKLHGKRVATRTAQAFIHSRLSDADSTQDGEVLHAALFASELVNAAIRLFQKNLESKLTISEVCRVLASSPRRLERNFERYCGTTPRSYYRKMRLDHARKLVLRTNMTLTEIAIASGFSPGSSFSSAFLKAYGITASDLRKSLND